MRDHDKGGSALDAGGKRQEVAGLQLLERFTQRGCVVVIVGHGAAVAGEVLEAGDNPIVLKAAQRHGDHGRAKLRVRAEGAAADHVVRPAAGDVGHRREIEVEAKTGQHFGDCIHGVVERSRVSGLTVGLHSADIGAAQSLIGADAADGAALLVHAEEERDAGKTLHAGQHLHDLIVVLQILRKVDQAADGLETDGLIRGGTGLCDLRVARQGLRRDEEELPELFLQRH